MARELRARCHRNAVHLFKTQGWVIDVGPLRHFPQGEYQYHFEIDGFTKPVAHERNLDAMPERFTFDVSIATDPTFDVQVAIPAKTHVPDVVLRCVKATFNELELHNEAQLARKR
jgi:hypothetical protein